MILRNDKGHYLKGQTGNPNGRPKKSDEFKKALMDAVTDNDIREIALKLVEDSKSDDFYTRDTSRKLLFDRVIGKAVVQQIIENVTNNDLNLSRAEKMKLLEAWANDRSSKQ